MKNSKLKLNDLALSVTAMKEMLPMMLEVAKIRAQITLVAYSSLLDEGCTEKEAVALTPGIVTGLLGGNDDSNDTTDRGES